MPVFAITATLAAVPISSIARSSFTIPIVLVLKMCLTVTKSKGLIMMSGLIENQKLSMVFGNLSDASVLPIFLSLPFFSLTRLSSCMLNQQKNIVFRYHIYTQEVNAGLRLSPLSLSAELNGCMLVPNFMYTFNLFVAQLQYMVAFDVLLALLPTSVLLQNHFFTL